MTSGLTFDACIIMKIVFEKIIIISLSTVYEIFTDFVTFDHRETLIYCIWRLF